MDLKRELMNIPSNYKVLFLQGGASTQFAMMPLNRMTKNGKADFVVTGQWETKAQKEAARYGEANVVASSKDKTFSYIPEVTPDMVHLAITEYSHIEQDDHDYQTDESRGSVGNL